MRSSRPSRPIPSQLQHPFGELRFAPVAMLKGCMPLTFYHWLEGDCGIIGGGRCYRFAISVVEGRVMIKHS
jgi:hypothetical protein